MLAACVTARLPAQGCRPLGSGRKTLKPEPFLAEPEEAGWWWDPFLRLPVPCMMWRVLVWAQLPRTALTPLLGASGAPGLCWHCCGQAVLPLATQGGEATQALKTVACAAARCAHHPSPLAHHGCQTESGPSLTLWPLPLSVTPLQLWEL